MIPPTPNAGVSFGSIGRPPLYTDLLLFVAAVLPDVGPFNEGTVAR